MNDIDFNVNQILIRTDWEEVIGTESTTKTILGFISSEKTKTIVKNSYRIVDAETDEVVETNTTSLPDYTGMTSISFKYSSDNLPAIMKDMMNTIYSTKPMRKLTIERPTCTLHGVFVTEWNPKIGGGKGIVDYISYK
ncbi:hypothetical protein [Stenotrophomonas phage RAS14]